MLKVVDSAANECDACAAFEKEPRFPVAGPSLAPASYEKLQVGLAFPAGWIASHAMDLSSR